MQYQIAIKRESFLFPNKCTAATDDDDLYCKFVSTFKIVTSDCVSTSIFIYKCCVTML